MRRTRCRASMSAIYLMAACLPGAWSGPAHAAAVHHTVEDTGESIDVGDRGAEWIGMWDGPVASIPAGWSAPSYTGGRFVYGTDTGEEPGALGGSATHSHWVNPPNSETRSIFLQSAGANLTVGLNAADMFHTHSINIPGTASSDELTSPGRVQTLALLGGDAGIIPTGLIAMWSGSLGSIPSGWALADGTVNDFDLSNRFIRGTHPGEEPQTITSAHRHWVDPPAATTSGPSSVDPSRGVLVQGAAHPDHTHTVNIPGFYSREVAANPPFHELAFIIRTGPPAPVPQGVIMMWTGSPSAIPSDWMFCDGTNGTPDMRNRFARATEPGEQPGATGGNVTHIHFADPPDIDSGPASGSVAEGLGLVTLANNSHTHGLNITQFPSGTGSSLPLYVRLAFVMKAEGATGVAGGDPLPSGRGRPTLHAAVPTPFTRATTVRFEIPRASRVELAIYDTAGRRIRSLASSQMPAGAHQVKWDGRTESGKEVAAGVYFVRLEVAGSDVTRKVIVVR